MFVRWNNTSKIWTTGMGSVVTKLGLIGLDANYHTTLMTPAKGDTPTIITDIMVITVNKLPMFLYAADLQLVDMDLIERSSMAHPKHMPVLCRPAYHKQFRKLNRNEFLYEVVRNTSARSHMLLTPDTPFTDADKKSIYTLHTIAFNDLNKLIDTGLVFVTDSEGETGKRYMYVETCQYDYLVRPDDELVWVRCHSDTDEKQPWVNWDASDWVSVSEDTEELVSVLETNF